MTLTIIVVTKSLISLKMVKPHPPVQRPPKLIQENNLLSLENP